MTRAQTYAWIFYAASAAAASEAVELREIEAVADGMNHAIPTQKEMAFSLKWAESEGLLERVGSKVRLTDEGRAFATGIIEAPGGVMKIWDRFTEAFQGMGVDNDVSLDCRTMKAE